MSKHHKLKTTRPEFLLNLMSGGDIGELTMGNMKRHLYDLNHISYCAYTALISANIDQDDVLAMNDDGESIAITFRSKKIAKTVKDACDDIEVKYGSKNYHVSLKQRDNHLVITVEEIE